MTATKELYNMFIENTGTDLCDSGGYNDRHWQKNLLQHPADRPAVECDCYGWHINTYKYLLKQCDLRVDDVCKGFNLRNRHADRWDADCEAYGVSARAWDWLNRYFDVEITNTWNTYNEGNSDFACFDQVLQGSDLTIHGEQYVLLQVHNGADVRGGYTNARLFLVHDIGLSYPVIDGTVTRDGETFGISDVNEGDGHVYICDLKGNETDPYEWREGDKIDCE